jgi:hypothetical protein
LLTSKIYGDEKIETSLIQNSKNEILIDKNDFEQYKSKAKPMVSFKPVINSKNKSCKNFNFI